MSKDNTPQTRSRDGCWTCKKRRRKCDQARPVCQSCVDSGRECEGYVQKLKWGNGIASRGHFFGALEPIEAAIPPRTKGRQRDILKATKQQISSDYNSDLISTRSESEASSPIASDIACSPRTLRNLEKESLFQEFLKSGSSHLFATTIDENPLSKVLPALCERSDTLRDVVVACQAYLSYGTNSAFYDFYSEALSKYRIHLDHPLMTTDEATINAALLLCTIGIMQGIPWSVHLHGIERLLDARAAMSPLDDVEPAFIGAIEVMGIMDLPRLSIGRQSPTLSAWRRYREGKLVRYEEQADAVQHMVGLPRSMLDLLAFEIDDLTEEQLLLWPGCQGTYLQCQLWEAYRFTLMLLTRRRTNERRTHGVYFDRNAHLKISLPTDGILTIRALSSIDAVFNGVAKPDAADSLILNAIHFPLFYVSLEVLSIADEDGRHSHVQEWWRKLMDIDPFVNTKQAWEIVQTVATHKQQGQNSDPEQVACSMGIELCLF